MNRVLAFAQQRKRANLATMLVYDIQPILGSHHRKMGKKRKLVFDDMC